MSNNNHFREDNLHSFGGCVNPGGKIYRKINQTGCSSMSDNLYEVPAFKDNCVYKEKKILLKIYNRIILFVEC